MVENGWATEAEILDIINTTVEGCYIGGLKVIVEDECTCKNGCIKLYTLLLYLTEKQVYSHWRLSAPTKNGRNHKKCLR